MNYSQMNVTVGGAFRLLTDLSTQTGSLSASGDFWLMFPICAVSNIINSEPGAPPGLLRPDLTIGISNALTQLRFTPLLATPSCTVRPGFAYQRYSFVGVFNQALSFRSYPLDSHLMSIDVVESVYGMSRINFGTERCLY